MRATIATLATVSSSALLSLLPNPAQAQTDDDLEGRRNRGRAERLLDSGEVTSGTLTVSATYASAEQTIAVALRRASPPVTGSRWRISVVAPTVDSSPYFFEGVVEWGVETRPQQAPGWVWSAQIDLPDDFQDLAVAVVDTSTGRWGATLAELTDRLADQGPGLASGLAAFGPAESQTLSADRVRPSGSTSDATTRTAPASGSAASRSPLPKQGKAGRSADPDDPVVKLIPPAKRPATGRVRVDAVTTVDGVRAAVFSLDGVEVARDQRAPFTATLRLDDSPRAYLLEVRALGHNDILLGTDRIVLNQDTQPFEIRIVALRPAEDGGFEVEAAVSVPLEAELERVEIFRNDQVEALLTDPPFVAQIAPANSSSDFIRAVAHLQSGEQTEDARLLSESVVSERVDVNLVEVYSIVTDREGQPVRDLDRSHFRLTQGKRQIEIEQFSLAEEVPLSIGLIIDSSESMDFLMDETKRAAATFLNRTVLDQDRAFLVDFDSQPRLAQALTPDVGQLAASLGRLQVGGNTALYDAVVFSLTQFEREPGRRALVLLTDGRDYGSKFGIKRCLEEARRLGVPVYVIAISDAHYRQPGAWMRKKPKKAPPVDAFLEGFSRSSGGRLFSIVDMDELNKVYETINAELRSQYFLGFSTPQPLTTAELESLELRVRGPGLAVRKVVLNR